MRILRILLTASCGLAALLAVAVPNPSPARPQYLRGFHSNYEELESITKQAKCAVCHCGKTKKAWNDYGDALKKELGDKNVKDREAIDKALDAIESLPSHVPDKTFGDLIREGRLPGEPCGDDSAGSDCGC